MCYCTEEYGPCEYHAETLVQREGASQRTADELRSLFIDDAVSVGAELSPYGKDALSRINANLNANRSPYGTAWLDDDSLSDELGGLVNAMETELYTLGLSVYWEDGYTIVRITGGPLSDEDEPEPVERIGADD